jgi:hypothetical protein
MIGLKKDRNLTMVPFESEDFWDDLLAFVEQGRVIPVVGPELLTIKGDTGPVPLYRVVADRLLDRYGIPGLPQQTYGLYEAVAAIAGSGKRVRDLYRPVADILQKVIADANGSFDTLDKLAQIKAFDLFVTTTPDDLLSRAIQSERGVVPEQIEYAPKLPTPRRRDIPETASFRYAAVFYLFGKTDVAPFYAIHEEDALEFAYTLQEGNGPERMFSQMRSRNLLLIGCTFAHWLSRFFIRLSNTDRLFSDQRTKKEYLVGEEAVRDRDFVLFLERFSQDSRCYPGNAIEFVDELHRRWLARNPPPAENPAVAALPSENSGTIFISYSSDDLAPARSLFSALQKIGGDVAWFDKSELKPGDDWERQILGAIQKCSLFVPVLSANTEAREEGYFRKEWDEAAERSRRIQGRKFIFPVVIDPECNMGTYALVPPRFNSFQFGHAPQGQMSDALLAEIQQENRNLRRSRVS